MRRIMVTSPASLVPLILAGVLAIGIGGCSKSSETMLVNIDKSALRVGLSGEVRRSPIMPLAHAGQDNSAPVPGASIAISKQPGGFVGNVVADSLGEFSVELQPGVYTLSARSLGSTFPIPPGPRDITVPDNGTVHIRLDYDTGVR